MSKKVKQTADSPGKPAQKARGNVAGSTRGGYSCALCGKLATHTVKGHAQEIEDLFNLNNASIKAKALADAMRSTFVQQHELSAEALGSLLDQEPMCPRTGGTVGRSWTVARRPADVILYSPLRNYIALLRMRREDIREHGLTAAATFAWAELISEGKFTPSDGHGITEAKSMALSDELVAKGKQQPQTSESLAAGKNRGFTWQPPILSATEDLHKIVSKQSGATECAAQAMSHVELSADNIDAVAEKRAAALEPASVPASKLPRKLTYVKMDSWVPVDLLANCNKVVYDYVDTRLPPEERAGDFTTLLRANAIHVPPPVPLASNANAQHRQSAPSAAPSPVHHRLVSTPQLPPVTTSGQMAPPTPQHYYHQQPQYWSSVAPAPGYPPLPHPPSFAESSSPAPSAPTTHNLQLAQQYESELFDEIFRLGMN